MTDRNTADFIRETLEQIDAKAPPAASDDSEAMTLHDWRSACRDMSRLARAGLKAIEEGKP
jgi:hypothetical protein